MQRDENENGVAWAAKLCAMMPGKWHLIDKPADYPADQWAANEWTQECITDGDVVLHIRGFRWNSSGKMTVRTSNPTTGHHSDEHEDGRDAYLAEVASKQWTTEIRFAPTRTVAQAWSEIDRRLLPDARRMMRAVRERVATLEADEREREAAALRITAAAAPLELRRANHERGTVLVLHGCDAFGDAKIYANSVTLELRNLTHDQAAAIFAALGALEASGANPFEEFAAESHQ